MAKFESLNCYDLTKVPGSILKIERVNFEKGKQIELFGFDPNLKQFRVVAPVLVRDNQVIADADGSSIDTGSPDATLMLYVPREGRYLVAVVPFEGAVQGNVHLGQITFSMEGHDYLLLTSMPITISEHVWVKHEPDFKASEHMMRQSEARDDQPMFLVRGLKKLQQERIEH